MNPTRSSSQRRVVRDHVDRDESFSHPDSVPQLSAPGVLDLPDSVNRREFQFRQNSGGAPAVSPSTIRSGLS
jgi:hypothetical protein